MWISFTYGLIGTITCLTLFILIRFTDVKVLEEEKVFVRSPHLISTLGGIKVVNQAADAKSKNGTQRNSEQKNQANANNNGNTMQVPSIDAVLLVNNVVNKAAASAANKNKVHILEVKP